MKKQIEEEILKRKNIYKSSPDDMISAYNRELETEKEYNGRQLLELLQNADDQASDEVYIQLDTNNHQLIIANRGQACEPFSLDGIKSLMISNLSSKVTKKYIGNKGLGFRSIINWSNRVTINSNNLDIIFSKEVVNDIFDELFNKKEWNSFIKKRNLSQGTRPIPFLAIPKIINNQQEEWITKIIIDYKNDFFEDIKKQIDDLKDEILLFLKHLKKLIINIDGDIREVEKREDTEYTYINNEKWTIYQDENILPQELWDKENEKEYYELKIALKQDCNIKNNLLYAYFPTQISMDFPFIIHGTFDLNSSRNGINKSSKNKYILEKLVKLITKIAKALTNSEVNYKALELLIYKDKHPALSQLDFYEELENAIETLEIFPCIDNSYKKRENVVYISNNFSSFLQKVKATDLFPNLLISTEESTIDISIYTLISSISTDKLNILSKRITNIDERVDLIHLFYCTFKRENQLLFLIDENNKFIDIEDKVYTPPSINNHLIIPKYVEIKFIHNELYQKLLTKFNVTSTKLVEELKEMTNIENYNPTSILNKIITATNKELKKENINQLQIIKEMILSLYSNYKNLNEKTTLSSKVQLISQDNSITDAKDLYLSKSYLSGKLTEELFGDIFEEKQFLIKLDFFGFEKDEDEIKIENFFLWLGVNRYTKFTHTDINKADEYRTGIFRETDSTKIYDKQIVKIDNLDTILNNLNKEKLISWILLDIKLQSELNEIMRYRYFYRTSYYLSDVKSYVYYQLSQVFKDYFLTSEKLTLLLNSTSIDFTHYLFKKYNLEKRDIESLILKLGAVENFEELSQDRVTKILKELPLKSVDGKYTQRIYQLVYKHHYQDTFHYYFSDAKLFAIKNGIVNYFEQNEVYYSGSVKLPKQILNTKAIFNFPKGYSSKKVTTFFGINDLSKIKINIISKVPIAKLTDDFNKFFKTLIPYILTYRIKDIEKDDNAHLELDKLKKVSIQLCDKVIYNVENQEFELEHSDYLKDEKEYLIHVDKNYSLSDLRQDFDFIDTFSDILGLVFKLEDTRIFRDIIKSNIIYIEKTIITDLGIEVLHRAKELMGIANEKESFWKTIYKLLKVEYKYEPDNLLESITNDLTLNTNITAIDYHNFKNLQSCKVIKELFIEIELTIEQYNNQEPYYKLDFSKYHNHNLSNTFHDNQKNFEQHLYQYCIENSKEREFLSLMDIYTHNHETIESNTLNIDYQVIIEEFIKNNFQFNISKIIDTPIDYEAIYERNKLKIDFEKIAGKRDYLSLLYFDKLNEIEKYIESLKEQEKPKPSTPAPRPPKPIINNPPLEKPVPAKGGGRKGGGGTYNPNRDKPKRDKGKEAEQDVYNNLIKEYGSDNVDWVSIKDDSLGYDIKYKNSNDIWKYVEVKTYSNNKFYLSKNEKRFSESYKEDYEIFLVGDEEIYVLTDINFYDKDKFLLEADNYVVYYGKRKN